MDQNAFEAQLSADGYSHIETKTLDPRPINASHAHDYDIRGLVLDGLFTVWIDLNPVLYQPGEIFNVSSGMPHSEEVGLAGARVVVGRKSV